MVSYNVELKDVRILLVQKFGDQARYKKNVLLQWKSRVEWDFHRKSVGKTKFTRRETAGRA